MKNKYQNINRNIYIVMKTFNGVLQCRKCGKMSAKINRYNNKIICYNCGRVALIKIKKWPKSIVDRGQLKLL